MISSQPMPNFKHRVIKLTSNKLATLQSEVHEHVLRGFTVRLSAGKDLFCRNRFSAIVEKLGEVNPAHQPSWSLPM
jgi:hypothetical protein